MEKRSNGKSWHKRTIGLFAAAVMLFGALAACSGKSEDNAVGANKTEMSVGDHSLTKPASGMAAPEQKMIQKDSVAVQDKSTEREEQLSVGGAAQNEGGNADAQSKEAYGSMAQIAGTEAGVERKVIYRANLTMKVEKFGKAEEQLRNLIHQSGAYLLNFSDSRSENEIGATYVIKVPSNGFTSFLDRLDKIEHKDSQRQVEGSDVTEEFVDLEARLKAKQVVEARLLAFMEIATKSDDLVRFSSELGAIQEEIERIKGRMRYLSENVAYSTVSLRLYESSLKGSSAKEDGKRTFSERLSDALEGSAQGLGQFGEGLLVGLAAILPVAIALAVIGIPTYWIVRSRQAARREKSAELRAKWNQREEASASQKVLSEAPSEEAPTDPNEPTAAERLPEKGDEDTGDNNR